MIVHSIDPVVMVGGANLGPEEFNILQKEVATFIGVDGGADHLLAHGITPAAVIGDLDSISDAARTAFSGLLHHIPEQDTVDFEKALTNICAPLIYALGFAGGRLDHTLAVLHVMGRHLDEPVILLSSDDASAIVPSKGITLHLPIGTRVSLMPLADARVDATGLQWPIRNQVMHPMRFTSPSNAAAGETVQIHAVGPVVVTLPRGQAAALAKAVSRGQ